MTGKPKVRVHGLAKKNETGPHPDNHSRLPMGHSIRSERKITTSSIFMPAAIVSTPTTTTIESLADFDGNRWGDAFAAT